MKCTIIFLFVFIHFSANLAENNSRPIIGIMAEEIDPDLEKYGTAYIAGSYVKFIESGGARVVPIRLGEDESYYKKLLKSINGLLLPGGSVDLYSSNYDKYSKIMLKMAVEANKNGIHFPVLGICLGFEMINLFLLDKTIFTDCDEEDVATKLNFEEDPMRSKVFSTLPKRLQKAVQTENITINYHRNCFYSDTYKKRNYSDIVKVIATSKSKNGKQYIANIEAVHFPFYGFQWHPEKNIFVWLKKPHLMNIPHTRNAIEMSQQLANFFVKESRKNMHRFSSKNEETESLIYNFKVLYTGKMKRKVFEQIYIIPSNITLTT